MSYYSYKKSMEIVRAADGDFYAVIMAAMRMADSMNHERLADAWLGVWQELRERYNAPCGLLPGECDNALKVRMTKSGELVGTN